MKIDLNNHSKGIGLNLFIKYLIVLFIENEYMIYNFSCAPTNTMIISPYFIHIY